MSVYCGIACRRKSFWCYRLLSTYVTKTRYLFELKEDDDACKQAQQTGAFYLFHTLAPLLQTSAHRYLAPRHSLLELKGLLGKFGQDAQRIEDSVLIGCSEQHEAWFALDLGLDSSSSLSASLQKPEMEAKLKGSFIELRKALFHLDVKDASLLFTAHLCIPRLRLFSIGIIHTSSAAEVGSPPRRTRLAASVCALPIISSITHRWLLW
ncbi:NAD(P)H pyrophosphatase NUDT13, mitochondrial isoform X4 [Lemur catta]|uniref:NAD(P)H pyrophosphatase NUDT13, mitochondrial isoform X4 n=1 Tax=Lemur catta TaxID=9447 RepID=UPI001E268C35|nr:NAD(P)H pyrophosphatase NUDT13, mitochondrial isoform X4 [Lemur catta]